MLLYGDVKGRIPVKLFTDSEPTLESIASSRQMEMKQLRMTIKELKEKCLEGDIRVMPGCRQRRCWQIV